MGTHLGVTVLLDKFFVCAAAADLDGYLECFTPDAIFVGTDPLEEWGLKAFTLLCRKAFKMKANGSPGGWSYKPMGTRDFVVLNEDIVWFYEPLHNAKYGHCRGTGLAVVHKGKWKIKRYVLSPALTNTALDALTTLSKEFERERISIIAA